MCIAFVIIILISIIISIIIIVHYHYHQCDRLNRLRLHQKRPMPASCSGSFSCKGSGLIHTCQHAAGKKTSIGSEEWTF